jgi:hypothetical protein
VDVCGRVDHIGDVVDHIGDELAQTGDVVAQAKNMTIQTGRGSDRKKKYDGSESGARIV